MSDAISIVVVDYPFRPTPGPLVMQFSAERYGEGYTDVAMRCAEKELTDSGEFGKPNYCDVYVGTVERLINGKEPK